MWHEGMLESWQETLLKVKLRSTSLMRPEDLVDAEDLRGISIGDIIPFSNSRVATHYGTCSSQYHHLQLLQFYREYNVRRSQTEPPNNAQGCRFSSGSLRYTKSFTLHDVCEYCHTSIKWSIASSRLIAIIKLPTSQLWKGVVTRKNYPSKYISEGCERCNVSSHRGHCMTKEHLNMETYKYNALRKSHHKGTRRCDCHKPCIGPRIRLHLQGGAQGMGMRYSNEDDRHTWCR
jgi:hypothetical protein